MNYRNAFQSFKNKAKAIGGKATAVGTGLLVSGAAAAQTAADVTAIIDEQKVLALAVVVAGTIAMLAIKYSKMARRA